MNQQTSNNMKTIEELFKEALNFHRHGNLEAALHQYRAIIPLNPSIPDVHMNMGIALLELDRFDEALQSCMKAVELNPNSAQAYTNLGCVFLKTGFFNEAVSSFQQALTHNPTYPDALYNLANALSQQGKLEESLIYYEKVLQYSPNLLQAINNYGIALRGLNRVDEAIPQYQRALNLQPQYGEAHFNLAMAYFLKGELLAGWPEYEWRTQSKVIHQVFQTAQKPVWSREPFTEKTLLIIAEQGYGDTFQFVRYLPQVKTLGGKVVLECQPGLKRILQQCKGIDDVIERRDSGDLPNIPFDFYIPLLSLPGLFNTELNTIPNNTPYLFTTEESKSRWKDYFKQYNLEPSCTKIGFVWAGSASNKQGGHRSCQFEDFKGLFNLANTQWFSLQKGPESNQFSTHGLTNIRDLSTVLNDFAETASAIEQLDLIITVDTSVAHLAGGLGKRVWVLLPYAPDWRWMLERVDSPWYPTMRLFRQHQPGNWASAFNDVLKAFNP